METGLFWLLAHALAPQGRPELPPLTFRSRVDYVEIDARVTDSQGRFVPDLKPEDFEVRERGERKEIARFSLVDVPREPLASRGRSDVATNQDAPPRRLYLLVLDDLHTAPARTRLLKKAARAFVEEHLAEGDLAGVVFASGDSGENQGFTSSREALLETIDRVLGKKTHAEAPDPDIDLFRIGVGPDPRAASAMTTYRTLAAAADALAPIQGRRKAVLWLSEGVDFDVETLRRGGADSAVFREMRGAIDAANRASVAFYGIDPRGLSFEDELNAVDVVRRAHGSLGSVSRETGGFAVYNQNDLRPGLSRVVEENSRYYLLGYYASLSAEDDDFREIEVRVKRPGLDVRARDGYVPAPSPRQAAPAAATDAGTALLEILESPVPVTGVPVRALAIPWRPRGNDVDVVVALEIGIEGLSGGIDAGLLAFDIRRGRVVANAGKSIAIPPDGVTALRTSFGLRLALGSYRIAAAIRNPSTGAAGSLFYDLELAKQDGAFFASILLTSERESRETATPATDGLPFVPTTRREFAAEDVLRVAADLYRTKSERPRSDVEIATVLRNAEGNAAYERLETLPRDRVPRAGYAFAHRIEIPLGDLPPGSYLLEWTARELASKSGLYRSVPLRISARADRFSAGTYTGASRSARRIRAPSDRVDRRCFCCR